MKLSRLVLLCVMVLFFSGQGFAQLNPTNNSSSLKEVVLEDEQKPGDDALLSQPDKVLLSNTIVNGVECSVSASVDKVRMYIGDVANYTVQATVPEGWSPDLGKAGPLLDKSGFEIRDFYTPEQSEDFTNARSFVFSTFTTGTYMIPSVPVEILQEQGEKESFVLATRPLTIEVVPVPPIPGEADDIRDIKGAMSIPMPSLTVLVLAVAGGLILIVCLVLALRKRGDGTEETVVTPFNAYETAVSQYRKLTADFAAGDIDVKIFHYGLTEILRLYLQGRYSFVVLSETTRELMESLRAVKFDDNLCLVVEGILEESDLVKFARFIPTDEETEKHSSSLLNFINDTKPSEDPNDIEDDEMIVEEELVEVVTDDKKMEGGAQ